ncbi:MAG TPA: iron uptake system protein EfeO [Candidatus Sulfotelmatobacter sp.]|nr:iron uptake system protein EfeO [Candidatus Sulfotelmatobacter sp.]
MLRRLAVAVGAAVLVTGCAGGASPTRSGSTGAATPVAVAVTLTDAGCVAEPASVVAGPVTFTVTNVSATAATEVELVKDGAILGEKEDLTPGLNGTFSLALTAGSYQLSCPGAATSLTPFEVTPSTAADSPAATAPAGPTSSAPASALAAATAAYADYVRAQVAKLVTTTTAFAQAVEAGDVARAKQLYAAPRVYYERIEPVAESFGDLDPRIDGRADDAASPDQFIGFHRLEQALWLDGSTASMTPIAQGLVADVTRLQSLVATATYQPAQLANGASELLDEVGASKITGEEERYSHLDLVDFQANVDGAQEAFQLLEPALEQVDPALAAIIAQRFADVDAALRPYRQGTGFVLYTALTPADTRTLAQVVDALAEPLSEVAAKVVGNA